MADFITTIVEMQNGAAVFECSKQLAVLVQAIRNTRKKGKLSLEIIASPSKVNAEDGKVTQVQLTYKVKTSAPAADPGLTTFFTTREGDLTRDDPAQADQEVMFAEVQKEIADNANRS